MTMIKTNRNECVFNLITGQEPEETLVISWEDWAYLTEEYTSPDVVYLNEDELTVVVTPRMVKNLRDKHDWFTTTCDDNKTIVNVYMGERQQKCWYMVHLSEQYANAVDLPYSYNEDGLKVSRDHLHKVEGFACAVRLPYFFLGGQMIVSTIEDVDGFANAVRLK